MNADQQNRGSKKIWLNIILSILLVAGGWWLSSYLISTAPKAERKKPETHATLVETVTFQNETREAKIDASGVIKAAETVTLVAEVSGRITEVNPNVEEGARLKKGEWIAKIDPTDYELAVMQAEASLSDAEANLALEEGEQMIARKDYKMMARKLSPEDEQLALRVPQLKQVQAALKKAQASLKQAQKELERTTIKAPFEGVVTDKNVAVGMQASSGNALLELVRIDRFQIVAEVDRSDLAVLDVAGGAKVTIRSMEQKGEGVYREGTVLRLLPKSGEETRRARLLIALEDPLLLRQKEPDGVPMFIGELVSLEIHGRRFDHTVSLPWELLRDRETVWILKNGTLEVKPIELIHRQKKEVLVRGIEDGNKIVTTNLGGPVPGMKLKEKGESSKQEAKTSDSLPKGRE